MNSDQVEVYDQWTALCHKAGLDPTRQLNEWAPPSWRPDEDERRLHAYRILDSYMSNVARFLLAIKDTEKKREHWEFGDARLLVNRIVSGLIGTDPGLRVIGSGQAPPDQPDLPEPPIEPEAGDEIAQRVFQIQQDLYREAVDAAIDEWELSWKRWPAVSSTNRWLQQWLTRVRFAAKVYEMEANGAVPLGDGVLVMDYREGVGPELTVYEPDSYFPVLDSSNAEFPTKVHLAWEEQGDDDERWVYRRTYELMPLLFPETGQPGTITRPWGEATHTCVFTFKRWSIKANTVAGGVTNWADLDETAGQVLDVDGVPVEAGSGEGIDGLDLEIDWIPVVHMPNTPATQQHFGRSSITNVIQLLDAIAAADTDMLRAAAMAGLPILADKTDSPPPDLVLEAGAILQGDLKAIDWSASLKALLEAIETLLDRLSLNAEVPAIALGRVNTNEALSGLAIALLFAPFDAMIAMLRLNRRAKLPLIGRWAIRWTALHDDFEEGANVDPLLASELEALFPESRVADVKEIAGWVAALLNATGISIETGLAVLQEAGLPIEDIEEELARIQSQDHGGAKDLADATGSEDVAREYLGLEPVDTEGGEEGDPPDPPQPPDDET